MTQSSTARADNRWRRRGLTLLAYLLIPLALAGVLIGLLEKILGDKDAPAGCLLARPFRSIVRKIDAIPAHGRKEQHGPR